MKKLLILAITLCSSLFTVDAADKKDLVDYVNPLVGSQSKISLSTGNTYPAIAMPWGMNFWMPQTGKMGDGWAYGNDDCGQMSAWYILSSMGFYPVCPGTDQYVLGAPYLPYMKVMLENGKTFEVKADKVSDKNRYVKSVKLNGKPYTKGFITQQDIMDGGTLTFEMTSSPNKKRVFNGTDRPYSLSSN